MQMKFSRRLILKCEPSKRSIGVSYAQCVKGGLVWEKLVFECYENKILITEWPPSSFDIQLHNIKNVSFVQFGLMWKNVARSLVS